MSPVPVRMAVTLVSGLTWDHITTPLDLRIPSVLGPLLQKLGNNFMHTLNNATCPSLQSTTTASTLLLSMKVEYCSTRLPLQISSSTHYQRIFIYTTSGGLRSMTKWGNYRFNQLTEIAEAQQGTCTVWWESLFAAV